MKKQQRHLVAISFFVVTFLGIFAFIISQTLFPTSNTTTLHTTLWIVSAVTGIGGFLAILNDVTELLQKIFRSETSILNIEPLQKISLEQLERRFVEVDEKPTAWIDRGVTKIDNLIANRKLIIVGPMKHGKSREAVELIRSAVKQNELSRERIFFLSPALPNFTSRALEEFLHSKIEPHEPLLLFLDDLPFHFYEQGLEALTDALRLLTSNLRTVYIVATGRIDQITSEHRDWLELQKFVFVELPSLKSHQVRDLVDNATALYQHTLSDDARSIYIESNVEGSPELTLLSFRRAHSDNLIKIDAKDARLFSEGSLIRAWAAARAELIQQEPAIDGILFCLQAFHAAGITSYESMVLAYAKACLPFDDVTLEKSLAKLRSLKEVWWEQDQIKAPDYVVESPNIRIETPRQRLASFFSRYNKWRGYRRPNAEQHFLTLLEFASETESTREIVSLYTAALRCAPSYYVRVSRGYAYCRERRLRRAMRDFNQAVKLAPSGVQGYNGRGHVYLKRGRFKEAIEQHNTAIRLNKGHASSYVDRGAAYAESGKLSNAIEDFTHALTIDPNNSYAYYFRGLVYLQKPSLIDAIADLSQAIQIDPNNFEAFYTRGFAYSLIKKFSLALNDYEAVVQIIRIEINRHPRDKHRSMKIEKMLHSTDTQLQNILPQNPVSSITDCCLHLRQQIQAALDQLNN